MFLEELKGIGMSCYIICSNASQTVSLDGHLQELQIHHLPGEDACSLTRRRDLYSYGFLAPALHSAPTVRNKVTNTRVPAFAPP